MKRTVMLCFVIWLMGGLLWGQAVDVYSRPRQAERSRDYDALHYLIRLDLDIAGRSFSGRTTVTLSPLKDGFDRCLLDAESYTVSAVHDNWGEPLEFEQTEKQLLVHMRTPKQYGETTSFTVTYAGRDPEDGLRFYAEDSDQPALVASDSWPDGVHHWFPCNDYPNDKITNELIATVKPHFKVASNGRLVSVTRDEKNGVDSWHWAQEQPHSTYLIVLAAAPYEVIHDSYGTIPIRYWVYPRHKDHARLVFGDTPKMMEFFNRIYGYPYPWSKYDQVVVPFGGGAESTSATVMGHRIMYDEKGEKDFPSIGIVSHELAHQWWGDLITLRSWDHSWMNESFGTYSDYLYQRFALGEEEGAVNLLRKKNSYLREARTRYIRPIVMDRYNRPGDLFDAHSYPKGAIVLHMLRSLIGDDAFFRTLKHFLHRHAFQPVDTHDFMKAVKTVTGQNMGWFFEQWIFSPGHPVFEIASRWDADAGKIKLDIRQVQDTSLGIPIFRMPVIIGITTPQGNSSHKVWLKEAEESFEISCPQKPLMVRFDEGNCLLKEWSFPKSLAELIFQLENDDVIGRMWAASELKRHGDDPQAVSHLQQSAREDGFWAVRERALETLRGLDREEFIPLFRRMSLDANSAVRTAALAALGAFQRPDLAGFFKERFQKDDSYRAQAQALEALGKTGEKSAASFLKQASQTESPRHVIRTAAERALKELEQEK